MCWLVSWLVAQVIPAASVIPASPARIHRAPWRLTSPTLALGWLRLGKGFLAASARRSRLLARERERRHRTAPVAVLERHLAAPLAGQLASDRQAEAAAGRSTATGAAAVKALEDRVALVASDPRAAIAHLDAPRARS